MQEGSDKINLVRVLWLSLQITNLKDGANIGLIYLRCGKIVLSVTLFFRFFSYSINLCLFCAFFSAFCPKIADFCIFRFFT